MLLTRLSRTAALSPTVCCGVNAGCGSCRCLIVHPQTKAHVLVRSHSPQREGRLAGRERRLGRSQQSSAARCSSVEPTMAASRWPAVAEALQEALR